MTLLSQDVYKSANGDTWRLVRHSVSGQLCIRHEANPSSGGHITELGVDEFLSRGGSGPEYVALRDILAQAEIAHVETAQAEIAQAEMAQSTAEAAPAGTDHLPPDPSTASLSRAAVTSRPLITDPVARATSISSGSIPKGGFASLVPELDVTDLQESLRFWCGLLGFEIAFDRPLARFAYLIRGPLQIMLCECNGNWEVAELRRPFGRGINFQMTVERLTPILAALQAAAWPLYRQPNDAWYRTGDHESGQREFLVQDPDGYLLRFAEDLGERPAG